MPDEDPGDEFLRHRGAVLDALLSDPALGQPSAPRMRLAPDPTSGMASGSGAELDPDPSVAPRRGSDGPKASERILALLNGQSADSGPSMDFSSEYTERAARNEAAGSSEMPAGQEDPPKSTSERSATGGRGSAETMARDVLIQLRKPKVALAVAAVLAVLLVLLLITTGGDSKDKKQAELVVVTPTQTAAPPPTSAAPPVGSSLPVKSAKSNCPPGSTSAMDAFGGEPGKAWSCVRAYKVDGQVLTIDLGKTYEIESIAIVPGWDYVDQNGNDQWSKYRTVSRVSYLFEDGKTYTQDTLDQRTLVTTKMDPPVSASKIVLSVLKSSGDPSVNTTAISSVVITGR